MKRSVAMAGSIQNRLKDIGSLELGFAIALPNLRTEFGAVGNPGHDFIGPHLPG